MDTAYTPEQEAFRDSLRHYLGENYDQGFARTRWNEPVPHTSDMWSRLVELGITALLVPEERGGLGMGMTDMGVVMEELGRRVNVAPVLASCVAATSLAVRVNDAEHLARLCDGSAIATVAFEEADAGFLGHPTPSVRARDGRLTGTKVRVLDALAANWFYVTAYDGLHRVMANAPGVVITPTETIDGSRRCATVSFAGAPGERVGDLTCLAPVIDRVLVALSADAVGAAEMVLSLAIRYAGERVQFGVPVGSFQAIQHMLAVMFQQVEMAKAGLRYALWALDCAEAREAHRAAVLIKAFTAETFPTVGANAVQIFGGAGFTWEYDVHLYYKRLLSAELMFGNGGVWLEEVARLVIDRA
jgi:alkylation response protein AidB-like acyl-CoA dehydrogenase